MAYTPVGWQTGDTITADRLNKMDRGWGYDAGTPTQLFSETVTTVDQGGIYGAQLAYSGTIDADTITVTFDGTEYECPSIGTGEYGAPWSDDLNAFDFSEFPFNLLIVSSTVYLTTQTAGEHTIAVTATVAAMQTSADFAAAVNTASPHPTLYVEQGTTTWQQVRDAMSNGIIVLFITDTTDHTSFYIASSADDDSNYEDGKFRVVFNSGNFTMAADSADSALYSE